MERSDRQTIEQLRAEIAFREKLSRQHVTGEMLLPDYYAKEEHDRILATRIDQTRSRMAMLDAQGVRMSPFLELGAERGQRALVLVNEFAADGVAADISYHQLRTMGHFADMFGMDRLPVRVCCDANHLPFRANSFGFVFAYQFLHHFPTLAPAIREIVRVLAGGHFYFGEEPFRRILRLTLYRQRSKIYSSCRRRRNPYRQLVESFISREACDEEEHGVLENDDIALSEWAEALDVFDTWDARLTSIHDISSALHGRIGVRNLANWLLGGLIEGLCRANGPSPARTGVAALLACPTCEVPTPSGGIDRPGLDAISGGLSCAVCGAVYPERDGILFLLPMDELHALYPDVADG